MSTIIRILGEAASSLGRSLSSPDAFSDFAASYGVEQTPGAVGRADLEAAFPFGAPLADLSVALAAEDLPAVAESVARFVAALQAASRRSTTSLPFPLNGGWFWAGVIGRSLIDGLLDALVDEHPSALPWLELAGLAEVADVSVKNRDGSDSDQWRGRAIRARLDRLPLLLRPEELLRQVYGWGGEFDHLTAALRIARVLEGFGGSMVPLSALASGPAGDALRRSLPGEQDPLLVGFGPEIVGPNPRAGEGPSEPAVIAVLPGALGMVLSCLPANERGDAGLGVRLYLGGEAADPTTSPVRIQVGAVGTYGLLIRPSGVRFVASAAGSLRATIDFAQLLGRPGDEPLVLGGATRLSLESLTLAVEASAASTSSSSLGASVTVEARRARLIIGAGEGDGFLQRVLPPGGLSVEFEFGIGWSTSRGFHFRGGASLDATLPLRISILGVLEVTALHLQLGLSQSGLRVAISSSLRVDLGPLSVVADRLGGHASLAFPSGGGNLGPVDLAAGFKPPTGLALSLAAGPVRGGGFVAYDDALGRYSGALALSIGDIALRAIGILDTRAPGVSGYSFLIVISAEFTPIQLGFGFTLTGVGGLCGIQRAVSVTALQEGVRSGTLASLLFSRDPIGHATQLIAGLQRAFPPTADRYVFGPMFKLGWGTPTLITADLGIVLQLPSPIIIALLGTLSAKLPRPEGAVVEINLDILGVLDLGEKKLSIDASLRDSRIAAFTLSGDLALRYNWGPEPDFALSLGGFNPAFRPPPGFPTLRRLSLALGSGNNPRLSVSAYFAVTSNSLQFGGRGEVYAEALGFNILGYLEFHALFVFSPFSFRVDFAAGMALRHGTFVLRAVSVTGRIEGPRPWHVMGSASVSILFFEVTVSFDETFGDPPERARIEPVNLWDPLLAALRDLRNWSATLPTGTARGVSTAADGEQPARVRLDPMSVLAVRQKVMPLDRRITRLGESPIEGPTRIRVGAVRVGCDALGVGGANVQHEALNEPFAAAQYESLDDAQRLSRPSFEPMAAGAQAQGRALATERPVVHRPRLETIRVGRDPSVAQVLQRMHAQMAQVDSASVAALRIGGAERYAPGFGAVPMMTLAPEQWALASTHDLRALTGSTGGTWGAVAEEARMRGDAGGWQVVPSHEVRP